jgi:triacylglycerol lipase
MSQNCGNASMDGIGGEWVILLHGLSRTSRSFAKLETTLNMAAYSVVNVDYPSRKYCIEDLANNYVSNAIEHCREKQAKRIHFVTHSMGGILVRFYLATHEVSELGRIVMLGPPNQGSEVIDRLGTLPGFGAFHGPAGIQLGTGEMCMPNRVGPVTFPLGVIAGNKSINWMLSLLIPGADDGKVSVARAKVEGMADFLVVPHSHPMMMQRQKVIGQAMHFLKHGVFATSSPQPSHKFPSQ